MTVQLKVHDRAFLNTLMGKFDIAKHTVRVPNTHGRPSYPGCEEITVFYDFALRDLPKLHFSSP